MAKTNLRKKRENLQESINVKKTQSHFFDLLKLALTGAERIKKFNELSKNNYGVGIEEIEQKDLLIKIKELKIKVKRLNKEFGKLSTQDQAKRTLELRKIMEDFVKELDKNTKI